MQINVKGTWIETDPGQSSPDPGAPDDGGSMPSGGDAVEIPPGKRSPVSPSDTSPGGGSNPKFSLASGGDPLEAFLDGMKGFSGDGGAGFSPSGAAGPPDTLLSNGLKADAAVAQLVNALASVTDNKSSFLATPFAAPDEPGTQGVIGAEVR